MKTILKTEYVNRFGETMVLTMDSEFNTTFFHDDILEEPIPLPKDLVVKYIFNKEELAVIKGFLIQAKELIK